MKTGLARSITGLAVSLVACSTPRAAARSAVAAPELRRAVTVHIGSPRSSVAVTPRVTGEPVLVWLAPRAHQPARTLVIVATTTGYAEIGHASGVWLSLGETLWRLRTDDVRVPLYACDTPVQKKNGKFGHAVRVTLEAPQSGRSVEILPAPAPDRANDFDESASLVGSVGPYLFLRSSAYAYACGAHGSVVADFVVWDGAHQRKADLLRPTFRAGDNAHDRTRAFRKLTTDPNQSFAETPADVSLVALTPRYGPGAALELDEMFAADACYACSGGDWSSYTSTYTVRSAALPPELEPFATAPAAVRAFAIAHPNASIGGYTVVANPAGSRADLTRFFHCAGPRRPGPTIPVNAPSH